MGKTGQYLLLVLILRDLTLFQAVNSLEVGRWYPKQNRILHKTNFANLLGWLEVREITKARGFGAGGLG